MKVKQLELDLWDVLSIARQTPENANLPMVFKLLDLTLVDRDTRSKLRIAGEAPTLSTVLKAGEVLYVPSHWFHYIVSLQKSAQCNTRSGIHEEGNPVSGGLADVEKCTAQVYDDDDHEEY